MNSNKQDPYLIPGTNTLINKFGIQTADKLQDLESAIYTRLNTLALLPKGNFDYAHLKSIHHHFFEKLYEWAGQERTVDIVKGHSHFARKEFIEKELNKVFAKLKEDNYLQGLNHSTFCKKLSFYFNEINAAHPFREGNGRTLWIYCLTKQDIKLHGKNLIPQNISKLTLVDLMVIMSQ